MKKLTALITIFISIFVLTGCVNTDITLDIDKKGNISASAQILSSDYLMKGIDETKLKESYSNVEKITGPGKTGYKITENLGNIKDIKIDNNKDLSKYADLIKINQEDKFLYNIYDVNIRIKDYMQKNMSSEEVGILSLLGSGFDLNFHLNTPLKLIESNATSNSEENGIHTYNWDFNLGNVDNIHAKVKIPNIKNIAMLVFAIIVLIGIIVFIIKKEKRKKNNI
ncbi:hypothetical protein [Romboutsia sp. 1001713B170131_170501_G6]|uniref:hypothetical protein n=1 Tax=Romboutsia sp. 1001713B170131_170501_G6 TaxID=2787108 RepID=UPI0018A98A46|nr:hypothetical protein [Romboutsia sp. 1001713B170131_170501_G6]